MAKYAVNSESLTAVADAIRAKTGGTEQLLFPQGMIEAIGGISGGGGGGAGLNIAYGDTAPEDTTKLWVKAAEPNVVKVTNGLSVDANSIEWRCDLRDSGAFFASAAVGNKVYMFGGEYSQALRSDKICVYDPKNNTIEELDEVMPTTANGHACAAVGTKVYIFGGYDGNSVTNRVDIFDTETETIRTCGTAMPKALDSLSVASVGKKVYIFGGNQRNVYEFDTETETFKTCSAVMPQAFFDAATASVGSKIYLFGGYGNDYLNTIYEFDTVADTVKTMGTTLPIKAHDMAAAVWGTKVYIFGGNCGSYDSDDIIVFDTATGAVETLETSLPNACSGISAATIGATVYLFGGRPRSGYFAGVYSFAASAPLAFGTMILQYTTGNEPFPIINSDALTIEIRPKSVHIGDESGAAQLAEAFIYKDGAWTAI